MSLKKNAIANYLGQGWTALMGLAFIPSYIHYLGIEAWGLVGFMGMMQAWLTLLDMGLSPTLSREMARFQAGELGTPQIFDLLRTLEFVFGGIALSVVCAVWLISPWLTHSWLNASLLPPAAVTQAVELMGFVLAARMAEQVYRGALQGLQQQVWLNGAQSMLATARWAGAVCVLAWWMPSLDAFFLWQGLISLCSVVILAWKTYRSLPHSSHRGRFSRTAIIRIRRFAGGIGLTTFLVLLLTQTDKLLLSKLISLEDFGYYTLAGTAAGALYFLISPIATAISPRLTELVVKGEQKELIATYHSASQWIAVMLIPAALTAAVFAEPLLYLWTNNFGLSQKTAPLLTLLALGTLCNGFMNIPYMLQLAYGWTGFAVVQNIIGVILLVPTILWSVPRFGAIGGAWIWFFLNFCYVFIGINFMHRKILKTEKWTWYLNSILVPLAAGLLATLCLSQFTPSTDNKLASIAIIIIYTIITTIAVLLSTPIPRNFLKQYLKPN